MSSFNFKLVLNMLNMTIDGIEEPVINKYNEENTKYGYILAATHSISSFGQGNSDLNYIVMMLDQVTGYDAIYSVNMSKELYNKLKVVPNDKFGNEEAIREAKEMLERSIVK